MESWLEWARGPAFVFCFGFMILGYLRHVMLTALEVRRHMRRAGDKALPVGAIMSATLKWLIPIEKLKNQFLFSITSILFHVAILVVPLFLLGHIALWTRGIGIWWPGIPNALADLLTIVAIGSAVALVLERAASRATGLQRCRDRRTVVAASPLWAMRCGGAHTVVISAGRPASISVATWTLLPSKAP